MLVASFFDAQFRKFLFEFFPASVLDLPAPGFFHAHFRLKVSFIDLCDLKFIFSLDKLGSFLCDLIDRLELLRLLQRLNSRLRTNRNCIQIDLEPLQVAEICEAKPFRKLI